MLVKSILIQSYKDLNREMEEGRFRKDLYFRIEVGLITLPSLRERRSDIPLLALYSMDNINKKLKKPKRLSQEAIKRLLQHAWPGNIRQLLNLLERTALTTSKDSLKEEDLIFTEDSTENNNILSLPEPRVGFNIDNFLNDIRSHMIHRALELSDCNKSAAARLLGVTPQAVHNFIKRKIDEDICVESQ